MIVREININISLMVNVIRNRNHNKMIKRILITIIKRDNLNVNHNLKRTNHYLTLRLVRTHYRSRNLIVRITYHHKNN